LLGLQPEHVGEIKRAPIISWTQAGNWQEMCETFQHDIYEEYVETRLSYNWQGFNGMLTHFKVSRPRIVGYWD
jgi:hypothetical protein